MAHDFVFRFVMLGETCVGKTTMILTLTGQEVAQAKTIATISVDFYTQNVTTLDGRTVKVSTDNIVNLMTAEFYSEHYQCNVFPSLKMF